jgi:uncharacterized membrane protein YjjP (DUF1212 family)
MERKLLLKFAMQAGEIMLRNGAETYRVEDTIERILHTYMLETVEVFVTPTCIFATIDDASSEMVTVIKRVRTRSIRLDKVSLVNDLSRRFVANNLPIKKALLELKHIDQLPSYPPFIIIAAVGFASAFFTTMFGGNEMDFFISAIIGFVLAIAQYFLNKTGSSRFLNDLIGGSIIGMLALLLTGCIPNTHMDTIITGSIMPLVPGVAITNAIRDTLEGDLVAGISRGIEAFFIAISIATGVGIVIKLWFALSGGVFI